MRVSASFCIRLSLSSPQLPQLRDVRCRQNRLVALYSRLRRDPYPGGSFMSYSLARNWASAYNSGVSDARRAVLRASALVRSSSHTHQFSPTLSRRFIAYYPIQYPCSTEQAPASILTTPLDCLPRYPPITHLSSSASSVNIPLYDPPSIPLSLTTEGRLFSITRRPKSAQQALPP